jgi:tetratricopeptide (TPR) repeat protein
MRGFNLTHILILVVPIILNGPALLSVAQAQTTSSIAKTEPQKKNRAERLDDLFSELKREPNQRKAKQLAGRIAVSWTRSGSATANALMAWSRQAMQDGRHSSSFELINQVIVLLPDYAEGWNRRATLHYVMQNYVKSMADIERTLALEPRHFGALVGMASILTALGEEDKAIKVYERVLSLYPANRNAQASMIKLLQKLEKSEI